MHIAQTRTALNVQFQKTWPLGIIHRQSRRSSSGTRWPAICIPAAGLPRAPDAARDGLTTASGAPSAPILHGSLAPGCVVTACCAIRTDKMVIVFGARVSELPPVSGRPIRVVTRWPLDGECRPLDGECRHEDEADTKDV